MKLLILGACRHVQVINEIAHLSGQYNKISFLDDRSENAIGILNDYKKFVDEYEHAFVAMGNVQLRKEWQEKLIDYGFVIPALLHSAAVISSNANIGLGSAVMAGAIIQPNAEIEDGCIISAGAIVDHDACVGEYSHINAGVVVPSMHKVPAYTKVDYGMIYRD